MSRCQHQCIHVRVPRRARDRSGMFAELEAMHLCFSDCVDMWANVSKYIHLRGNAVGGLRI